MPSLAPHMTSVPGSGIRRVFEIAMKLDDVTMLVVGEPDVPVAHHIIDAARRAWAEDRTGYTPNGGVAALREALVAKLARENGITADVEQVWVTVGATQGLHQAMGLLLGAGDEILVPDPGYTTFTMNAHMFDARPVPYTLLPDNGFLPDLEELAGLVTAKTRAIIVNSPSNPLGVVFDEAVLRGLLAFAKEHDLWVISDEVYEYFTYGATHTSLAALDDDDRVFSVFSLSKTYAMTGVRVGYLVAPKGLAATMRTVQEAQISCVAEPDQFAALAAVTGDNQPVADAREHYRENLELARSLLDERGFRYLDPQGAFYLWIDVSHVSRGDVATWAEDFLLESRVAVAPGSAFGRSGEGWIRISLASPAEAIARGLAAIPSPRNPA